MSMTGVLCTVYGAQVYLSYCMRSVLSMPLIFAVERVHTKQKSVGQKSHHFSTQAKVLVPGVFESIAFVSVEKWTCIPGMSLFYVENHTSRFL